jgi:glyoxylase-like metal-dependent hydrolase (beta-lactamase superfamily II)
MHRSISFFATLSLLFLTACSNDSDTSTASIEMGVEDMAPSINDVATDMGLDGVDSLTLSGSAWRIRNSFQQTPTASPPWPERDDITNWVQTIDFTASAMRGQGDTFASNLFFAPAVAGTHVINAPAGTDSWRQQMEVWLTPWGFVKGAQRYGAQSSQLEFNGNSYTRFSFSSPESMTSPSGMRYTVNGYVNTDGQVVRTETWVEDAFMGDMHVVGTYADYESHNGLMVPTTFEQQRGGGGIFGVTVSSASANPANLAELIPAPESNTTNNGGGGGGGGPAASEPPADLTQQVGDGAWLVTGGYVSLVVEFSDHLAVFESGQSESRGEQIIQQIRDNISDKEIRYIINSHPHSDHTAGLVPFMREGATLVTHEANVDFLDMALNTPRTLLGEDSLNAEVMGITGVGLLEDDTNRLELHHVPNLHTDGMVVALLPEQGILFQADFTLPQPDTEANPFVKTLARYISENDVQFENYLAVHAAAVAQTRAELLATIAGE